MVALSGGADSCALTVIFYLLAKRSGYEITALHVNHCLRREADEDDEFTAKFCEWLNIPRLRVKTDVRALAAKLSVGLEEAGRKARRDAFKKALDRGNYDHVLLAHHAGDLCEDIFMRLTRGAGWPALGGMEAKTGPIIRPLLKTSPKALRILLEEFKIPWREDASNASPEFRRNRYRLSILPLLRAENPNLDQAALNLRAFAQADSDFWQIYLDGIVAKFPMTEETDKNFVKITLPPALLRACHEAARLRLYMRVLKSLREKTGVGQARADILFALEKSWKRGLGGKIFQLPRGVTAIIKAGAIVFSATIPDDLTSPFA